MLSNKSLSASCTISLSQAYTAPHTGGVSVLSTDLCYRGCTYILGQWAIVARSCGSGILNRCERNRSGFRVLCHVTEETRSSADADKPARHHVLC